MQCALDQIALNLPPILYKQLNMFVGESHFSYDQQIILVVFHFNSYVIPYIILLAFLVREYLQILTSYINFVKKAKRRTKDRTKLGRFILNLCCVQARLPQKFSPSTFAPLKSLPGLSSKYEEDPKNARQKLLGCFFEARGRILFHFKQSCLPIISIWKVFVICFRRSCYTISKE